ncbi:AraC family transcriptional regulator [Pedosphaera parvula]|uniref:Transcriptional regulator, AraC family n=1 Tax=Pedosphaera parvula (strain Ellin514) TaxID=320771 RepID=B9XR23_PEDPL|nr:AraC family transcriptional regulator [Pedosphaera parvula]EEF57719.1 transcriptional regulator, AraC family [Pedosphaera parvula Ellin514]
MDALAAVVTLLKPQAIVATLVHGSGRWGVSYSKFGHPSFALVLKGPCWLSPDGIPAKILETGDFVLFPATPGFTLASDSKTKPKSMKPIPSGKQLEEVFHGDATTKPSASLLGGYFTFDSINSSMLLDLLPKMVHLRGNDPGIGSVVPIIELIKREALEKRAGQSLVLTRLIEIMLVEALRSVQSDLNATGLLAGLRDPQLATALRGIHTRTEHPWTLATLAREAGMSRSSFAARFGRVIGMTPLNYLLHWRLSVAKAMLNSGQKTVTETALAVGYESASGFSTAFSRETGQSPKQFIKTTTDVTRAKRPSR